MQRKLVHIDIDIDADPEHLYANITTTNVKAVFDVEVVHDIDTDGITHFDLFCHWQYGSTVVCFASLAAFSGHIWLCITDCNKWKLNLM